MAFPQATLRHALGHSHRHSDAGQPARQQPCTVYLWPQQAWIL